MIRGGNEYRVRRLAATSGNSAAEERQVRRRIGRHAVGGVGISAVDHRPRYRRPGTGEGDPIGNDRAGSGGDGAGCDGNLGSIRGDAEARSSVPAVDETVFDPRGGLGHGAKAVGVASGAAGQGAGTDNWRGAIGGHDRCSVVGVCALDREAFQKGLGGNGRTGKANRVAGRRLGRASGFGAGEDGSVLGQVAHGEIKGIAALDDDVLCDIDAFGIRSCLGLDDPYARGPGFRERPSESFDGRIERTQSGRSDRGHWPRKQFADGV